MPGTLQTLVVDRLMPYGLSVTCEVALLDKRLGSAAVRTKEDTEAKAANEHTLHTRIRCADKAWYVFIHKPTSVGAFLWLEYLTYRHAHP